MTNKKYESLATFLRDQNTESLLFNSIDSTAIMDLIKQGGENVEQNIDDNEYDGLNISSSGEPLHGDEPCTPMDTESVLDYEAILKEHSNNIGMIDLVLRSDYQ